MNLLSLLNVFPPKKKILITHLKMYHKGINEIQLNDSPETFCAVKIVNNNKNFTAFFPIQKTLQKLL